MKPRIHILIALLCGVVIGGVGFGALHAQTRTASAYWVTEVLEMGDQAAFMKAIEAVPPTVQPFGGHYAVLGGRIAGDVGPPPRRIAIIAFDSMDKAEKWVSDPAAAAARAEASKYAKTRSFTVEGVAN
jgi:uncharacterized protein (DUF1330 family)